MTFDAGLGENLLTDARCMTFSMGRMCVLRLGGRM